MLLLNNTHNYKHSELFGIPSAIFDRSYSHKRSTELDKLKALGVGETVIICSKDRDLIRFDTCVTNDGVDGNRINEDGSINKCYVLKGKVVKSESIDKSKAFEMPKYRGFFNINDGFKRSCVVKG